MSARRLCVAALAVASFASTVAVQPAGAAGDTPAVLRVAEGFRGAGTVTMVEGRAADLSTPVGTAVAIGQVLEDAAGRFFAASTMTASGNTAWIGSPQADGTMRVLEVRYRTNGAVVGSRELDRADPDPQTVVDELYDDSAYNSCAALGLVIGGGSRFYGIGWELICATLFSGPPAPSNGAAMNWDGQTETAVDFQPQTTTPGVPYSAVADFWVKPVGCQPAASTNECKLANGDNFPVEMALEYTWPDTYQERVLVNCLCNYRYFLRTRAIYQAGVAYQSVKFTQYFPFSGGLSIAQIVRVYEFQGPIA